MKNIKFAIIDKDTLELLEDANKGDKINLKEEVNIDTSYVEELIKNKKDLEYNKLLDKEKKELEDRLNKEHELSLIKKEDEVKKELEEKIKSLTLDLEKTKASKEGEIKLKENEIESKYKERINNLNNEINNLNNNIKSQIELEKRRIENEYLVKKEEYLTKQQEEIEKLKEDRDIWHSRYNDLSLKKNNLNVKKLGEELEKYCFEEYQNASVAGFNYSTFIKDNESVKEEGETKGTKADYIFKVYSSSEYKDENVLTSVCLEMKNEAIESTNKKKNSDHYAKLDKDRNKKNCEYALLVSELEWDSENDSPIKKVKEFPNMFVVRPQYMISFLSLIYTLANKYKETLTEFNKEKFEFKTSQEIKEEFDNLKNTYFIKPLEKLEKQYNDLKDNNEKIINSAEKNRTILNTLINNGIYEIRAKIERFDISKITKKLDKLEND